MHRYRRLIRFWKDILSGVFLSFMFLQHIPV